MPEIGMGRMARGFAASREAFEWAVTALRRGGQLQVLRLAIGALCWLMVIVATAVQFHPAAPDGLASRTVHGAVVFSAAVVGTWWIAGTGFTYRSAVLFIVWADLAIGLCALLMSTPAARLCTTIHMGLIGIFIAFLLGMRPLLLHAAFCATLIVSIVIWSAVHGTGSVMDLFLYWSPALSTVVVTPLLIQIVIEGGRRSIRRAASLAMTDPLTGLHNRRGLRSAVAAQLSSRASASTVCVCVCDIDEFKRLNDTYGHELGDRILVEMARQLESSLRPGDLAARTGGDELALVAFCDPGGPAVHGLQARLQGITELALSDLTATTSIGIAARSTTDPHFDFEDLLRCADRAMYEVKRRGGAGVAVSREKPAEFD